MAHSGFIMQSADPSEFELFLELTRGRRIGKREGSDAVVSMTAARVLQYLYSQYDGENINISARKIGRELSIDHRTVRRVVEIACEWSLLTRNSGSTEALSVTLHKDEIDRCLKQCNEKLKLWNGAGRVAQSK